MSKNIWYWLSNRFFQIANRRNASRIRRFGAGAPRRQSHHRSLHVEVLEDRCYLSASLGSEGESRAAGLGAPLAAISEQQAVALAVNNLTATQEGFVLTNPRHTATFTSEGLRMEPADGGPQWQWQLSYVGTLFNSLAGVQVGLVAPESSGANLVSYDRGGLIEQYVAHAGSIEQQFVIPQPLALGGGDLVLAGTVHSAGFFEATTDGWQWSTDAGAISLGDVTVLDATGSEIAASMQVNATGTRIVIEADVLAGALYPLLIDPEVGANDFRISDMGPDASVFAGRTPAVAYNSTNNEYLVVWSGDDVTNDEFEIFGQRINAATGAEVGTNDFRISDMGPDGDANFDAFTPAVAYRSTNNQYLVVWSGDDNTGLLVNNEFEIFGQRINAATGAEVGTNDFRISDMGTDGNANFDALTPEVVACSSFKTEYLVVWSADDNTATLVDDEFEIFGQRLNAATGAEDGTNDFRISNMGPDGNTIFRANQPALAYNSKNNEYFVVWRGNNNTVPQPVFGEGEFEIFGQRLDVISNAEVGTNDFRISDMGPDGNINFEAAFPAVAYDSTNNIFLVVWEGEDNTAPLVDEEREIFGQRLVAATGQAFGTNDFRISDMGPDGNAGFDAFEPTVAYNRTNNEYLVTWRGDDNTAPLINSEFEIFGQRLNAATGAAVGANDFRLSNMGPDGNAQFVAFNPAVVYNSTNQEYLVVWSGNNQNQEFEIFGQRLSAATGAAIGTNDFRLSDTGGERNFTAFLPAVAYNSTNNEYLVVWVGSDTTINEFDIFGQRINAATGAEVGVNDFRISDMGPDGNAGFRAFQTAVAYNITNNEYLVVWSGDDNTAPLVDDEREIFGQRLNATTGAAVGTNDFRISDMGPDGNTNFFAIDPAVAYNSTNNEYLVVWHGDDNTAPLVDNEVEIFGQRLNAATGTEVGTNDFRISEMGPDGDVNFRAAHAAVAYNNTNNEYLVVWDGNDNEREIFGQRLNAASGAAVGIDDFRISDMGPNGNPNFAALVPSVAYNSTNNEYLVVWSGDDNTAPLVDEEREIFGQRLDATGSDVGANDFRISDMGPNGNPNFAALVPSVAYNSTNNEYLVVWEGDDNTSPLVDDEFEIFGQQISATGGEVGTNDFRLSDMGPNGNASFDAEVPNVAYNSTNNLFLVVWDGLDNGGALGDGEKEIFGQRFEIGDFGDAPDSYATRLANNGAWHRLGTPLFLGAGVDGDNDGLPTANARGDDTTDSDDEDGVTIGVLSPGSTNTISVVASASGKLDAFVDFNRDGDFADLGEKIFQSMAVAAGSNSLSFSVPAGAKRGNTFARFRLSTAGGLSFGGRASDGEVEDYRVHVQEMRLVAQGNNVLFIRPVVDQPGTVVGNRMAGAWELPLQSFGPSEPIIVNAVDGDDKMTIPNAVNRSVFVDGGKGNDQFDAELDHDALAGGDWLISSAVRDWYWRLSHYALADLQSPDELIR